MRKKRKLSQANENVAFGKDKSTIFSMRQNQGNRKLNTENIGTF